MSSSLPVSRPDAGHASTTDAYLDSDRISPRLARILAGRAEPDDPHYRPRSLSPEQFAALRAALDEVIPQDGPDRIDLAARLDAMMADKEGNGWRYEALPGDPDAYRHGLDALNERAAALGAPGFAALAPDRRAELLQDAERGEFEARALAGERMTMWFEELRSDAVRLYVAHPRTLARMGYSGVRNGRLGGADFTGFERIGIGERDPFEPLPAAREATR